jgi:hypothetical protein
MCCFSGLVEKVSDTSIFARASGERQLIIYSMAYAASNELAMVLPIPVVPGSQEDSVRFINLEDCPDFFDKLRTGFPPRYEENTGLSEDIAGGVDVMERKLHVHEVGAYEASFVPRPEDFGRLDERFRLPVQIWLELREYQDWGFAVFKLKPTGLAMVHPMAFEFPRRDLKRLFFPTLHLHGHVLEKRAEFDHMLYCQPQPSLNWHLNGWTESDEPISDFVRCPAVAALLDLEYPCWQLPLEGELENRDTWLG